MTLAMDREAAIDLAHESERKLVAAEAAITNRGMRLSRARDTAEQTRHMTRLVKSHTVAKRSLHGLALGLAQLATLGLGDHAREIQGRIYDRSVDAKRRARMNVDAN